MKTSRLEAFSDGVFAIIITIMVLELKVPEGADFSALKPLTSKFLSYVLSFIYLGIYWNNHHHLFQAIKKVNGKVLWANLALLFVLSLIPFTTAWMGENHFEKNPVALYGINLMLCALTYTILEKAAIRHEGKESAIGVAIKNNFKEYVSLATYVLSTLLAFFVPALSIAGYALVAVIWLIPDTRIESQLK
ncbi:MAG: DUF1211 domain-containing protein [Bacteroidetes bacterium]|nr:DUF1211 domain-containing protein [Bacteroidota bacterium]